jgi:microcin C transport system substrate-binding protein
MLLLVGNASLAASSAALGYAPKYRNGFKHFQYVNPRAPRGGELVLSGFGNFDSFNPYVLRGVPVDGLGGMIFEPLMVQAADEPYGLYAHIASDIQLAADRLSVRFRIDPAARFSNGRRVTADDVKFTFDTLKSDKGHPYYRFYWADIRRAVVVSPGTIRFEFRRRNPELHLIAASIPVFAPEWVGDTPFDKLSKKMPIGTGPYRIQKYRLGKDITFQRRNDYWAENKNTRRGMYNFDRVTYKYYKDETIQLEALKSGEFDFVYVLNSKQWARDYRGPQFETGRIKKQLLSHRNSEGMQGFIFNTRRDLFKDVRVRRALTLAFDFEWSNKNLFYGQYKRYPGRLGNCAKT